MTDSNHLLPTHRSDCCLPSGHLFRFSNCLHKLLTATTWDHFLTTIGLLAAVAGIMCLFFGSFSENQFKDAVKWKVVVFTILPLLVPVFLWKARKCNEVIEKVCHKHVHIKTVVRIVLLGCATTVNLLIKFPRFNVHNSNNKNSSIGQQGNHSQGSRFNLYSAGSFSAFALVISSKGEKAMELGIFDFLLGLTMDASMEIPGIHGLNLLYMLGAFVYCASLIFISSYLESFMLSRDISPAPPGNIPDLTMVLIDVPREDATEETVNRVTYDPATEDCGETIGHPHVPKLMRSNTMPELMRSNTMPVPVLMRSYTMPELMRLNSMPDLLRLKTMPQLKKKRRTFFSSNISHLRDLLKKKRRKFFSSNISHPRDLFRKERDGTSLPTEDWQKNRVRTDVSEIESLSHGLRRRRKSTMLEPHTYQGDVLKGSGMLESEIPYEGWRQNGGSVSVGESSILESKHGVEQRDEIDGSFLDVVSSEDAYVPDGLTKRRNVRGMKRQIRNLIPGIVKDRLPNIKRKLLPGVG